MPIDLRRFALSLVQLDEMAARYPDPGLTPDDVEQTGCGAKAKISSDRLAERDTSSEQTAVHDLNGTVALRSDGVIVDLDIELTGHDFDDRETTLEIGESISAIGTTTVTEPTWLAEAQDRAAVMVAELDTGRESIAISLQRGDPIPPGSTGYLYVGDVALETPIEAGLTPGESFYLYETTAGELTIAMTPPTGSAVGAPVPDGLQEVSVAIYHPDHGSVFASTLTVGNANDES